MQMWLFTVFRPAGPNAHKSMCLCSFLFDKTASNTELSGHNSSSCVCLPRTSHAGPCQILSWKVFASVHNLKGITVAGFKLKVRRSSLTRWMKTNTWQIWSHSLVPSAFLSLSVSLSVCKWAPQTVSRQVCQVYEPHHPLMPPVFPCL